MFIIRFALFSICDTKFNSGFDIRTTSNVCTKILFNLQYRYLIYIKNDVKRNLPISKFQNITIRKILQVVAQFKFRYVNRFVINICKICYAGITLIIHIYYVIVQQHPCKCYICVTLYYKIEMSFAIVKNAFSFEHKKG